VADVFQRGYGLVIRRQRMKFTDDEAERRYLANQNDRVLLQGTTKEELINAQIKLEKLLNERRAEIRKAYLKLPPVSEFEGSLIEWRVPYEIKHKYPVLVTKDFVPDETDDYYAFVMCAGRWVMSESEYNRHLYKGLII
jgi:hypothetical protein